MGIDFDSDTGSVAATFERLTPLGRAVVLAFADGASVTTGRRDAVAVVLVHRCLLNTGYSDRMLAKAAGLKDHKLVARVCARFSAFLREMISSGRLHAASMLER